LADAAKSGAEGKPFKGLLKLPPLSTRAQPPSGIGVPGARPWGGVRPGQGQKRPWERDGNGAAPQGPPQKRPFLAPRPGFPQAGIGGQFAGKGGQAAGGNLASARMAGARFAAMHALRPRPTPPRGPPPGMRPAASPRPRPIGNGKGVFTPHMMRPAAVGVAYGKGMMRPGVYGFSGKR